MTGSKREDSLAIRRLSHPDELRQVQQLQIDVWGFEPLNAIPVHQLLMAGMYGGSTYGAYDGDRLVAFCYGFIGLHGHEPVFHSHMAGVLPAYQDRGLGKRLKEAQRQGARDAGLKLITWTFDPLESRNAYFNLHKLGARVQTYYVNVYGEMTDALNYGLPSDRLLAEWPTHGAPLLHRPADPAAAPCINRPLSPSPVPRPAGGMTAQPGEYQVVRVAFPAHSQSLKREHLETVIAWRLQLREIMVKYFAAGYRGIDVIPPATTDLNDLTYYVLSSEREV